MKTLIKAALIIFFVAAFGLEQCLACTFNTDCYPGSRCVKQFGQFDGVCVGGISPGNKYDYEKGYNNPRDSYGNTCSFNADCDPGYVCVRSGIEGVCMRRR